MALPFAMAIEDSQYESYSVGEDALLKIRVANATDVILDANCTVDIYNPDNTLVVDDGELTYGGRRYSYLYNFNESGEWFVEYFCYNPTRDETTIMGKEISVQEIDLQDVGADIPGQVWSYQNRTLTNASNIAGDI